MRFRSRLDRLEHTLAPRSRLCVLLDGKCVRGCSEPCQGCSEPCQTNGHRVLLNGKGAQSLAERLPGFLDPREQRHAL